MKLWLKLIDNFLLEVISIYMMFSLDLKSNFDFVSLIPVFLCLMAYFRSNIAIMESYLNNK